MAIVTESVVVTGLTELDDALRGVSEELEARILGEALHAGGEVILAGTIARIPHRSGQTAGDMRLVVQTSARSFTRGQAGGAVAIGAGPSGKGQPGREAVLRFLQFGTKPHEMPKPSKRKRKKKGYFLAFAGRVMSHVNHPGMRAQQPLTRALAEEAPRAVAAFARTAWAGIAAAAVRLRAGTGGLG